MASDGKIRVGIVGASGFTGAELMRLIAGHPDMELVAASGDTQAGTKVRTLYPNLAAEYGEMAYSEYQTSLFEASMRFFLVCLTWRVSRLSLTFSKKWVASSI